MSVILKALRSQQEGTDSVSQGTGVGASSDGDFHIDSSGHSPGTGGPGSNKRTLVLIAILIAAIILAVVLRLIQRPEPAPAPRSPAVKTVPAPPAVEPTPAAPPVTNSAANDLSIARSQYASGEYDESLRSFQKALALEPNNASIHNDMGLALLKKELYTSAESHFAKALELDDTCAECYNNLGYLKTTLDQTMEAEKYLQKAIALKPEYPDPYFNLGVLYEKTGSISQAVDNYRAFLKLVPKADTDLVAKIKSRIHELSGD